jgi:nucleoside-diphosphate-sugar epimerase
MTIGVIGCEGFVGASLCRYISTTDNDLVKIHRNNFDDSQEIKFDVLINAATPSKKYWALNNPLDDFQATVGLTAEVVYNWQYDKLIQISTISAQCQLDHPYGINKYLAEQLVLTHNDNNLIIRLGNLFGEGLKKGIVYDIINNNTLFVSGNSRYTFIDVDKAAKIIYEKLGSKGIEGVSSRNSISLKEIVSELHLNREFGDRVEILPEPENSDSPDVAAVVTYIKKNLSNINT